LGLMSNKEITPPSISYHSSATTLDTFNHS
jgi:hypothetical protein